MIKIFTGDDRVKASAEIKKTLGENYEVIDAADLTPKDLPQIFKGTTIFEAHRKILLRDFTANAAIYPELTKYLDTPHEIILLETKLDKRLNTYKEIKDKLEIKEFKLPPKTDFSATYNIYNIAKRDGKKAVEELRKIEKDEDPIRFTGLLISQAMKEFSPKILKELSKLDMNLKSSKIDPWLLVESFLLSMGKQKYKISEHQAQNLWFCARRGGASWYNWRLSWRETSEILYFYLPNLTFFALAKAESWALRREAVFFLRRSFFTALSYSDWALAKVLAEGFALKAFTAALMSFLISTLCAVRFSAWRAAFFADLIIGINLSLKN